jgi:hypothetical protein
LFSALDLRLRSFRNSCHQKLFPHGQSRSLDVVH